MGQYLRSAVPPTWMASSAVAAFTASQPVLGDDIDAASVESAPVRDCDSWCLRCVATTTCVGRRSDRMTSMVRCSSDLSAWPPAPLTASRVCSCAGGCRHGDG